VLSRAAQDEKEFRDKLSSIYVSLNFSLDADAPADAHGLRPILNYQAASLIEQKVPQLGEPPGNQAVYCLFRGSNSFEVEGRNRPNATPD